MPSGPASPFAKKADRIVIERPYCELARDVYQAIDGARWDRFTFSFIDSAYHHLDAIAYELERLPEREFREMIEVLDHLTEARNELRLARFLFEVEEIDAVYRLIIRHKAVLSAKFILHRALRVWPSSSSSPESKVFNGPEDLQPGNIPAGSNE